jgi:hypothetical protein
MLRRRSLSTAYRGSQTLYYAGEQAERIGLPLNNWVTINFASTSIEPWDAALAFARYRMNYFNKWARRLKVGKAFEPTYAYVFENERDGTAFTEIGPGLPHNVHVHWRVHVPPSLQHEFECLTYQWLDAIAGTVCSAGAVKVDVVRNSHADAVRIRAYMLKGSAVQVAKHFGAATGCRPQGAIVGRRSGTSENLGPSARRALDAKLKIKRRVAA